MTAMMELQKVELPPGLILNSAVRNDAGETNNVFFCTGVFAGHPGEFYVKVAKRSGSHLAHERAILERLALTELPVPRVIWQGGSTPEVLVLEALPGRMIWDYIDPRRSHYDPNRRMRVLRTYGQCLGRIHALPIGAESHRRSRLYSLLGKEQLEDARFRQIADWLRANPPRIGEKVFVHGDLNTASILIVDEAVSGIVDWEFAGSGWREYDLAWVLRARTAFLNTPAEREAVLEGYASCSSYDAEMLRYCEVLNYLHFAFWDREIDPAYTAFALTRAAELAGLPAL